MCQSLSHGGLGIRDLGCLNQALLAKVAWRWHNNADSPLAKVLLGKYCNKEGFLSVKAKSGCSWGWRSILWGRDLLVRGLKWEVGNGQDINGQGINPFIGREIMGSLQALRVGSLIDWRTGKWHTPLIEAFFPEDVAKRILATYILEGCREDSISMYWTGSRSG